MTDVARPKLDWRVVFNTAAPPGHRGWGRVRAAQAMELARAVRFAAYGQAFNAIMLGIVAAQGSPRWGIAAWLTAIAAVILASFYGVRSFHRRPIHSLSRKAIDRASYCAVPFAFAWAVPAQFFFPNATQPEQLVICVITAGMMAGAAFIFSAVPAAAAGYVLVLGVAATDMLWKGDAPLAALIGPAYTIGLLILIYSNGRAFMQRKCVELALEDRNETVSMLLRDFESSDADWLWQTNAGFGFRNVSARFARAIGCTADRVEGCSIIELLNDAKAATPSATNLIGDVVESLERRQPLSEVVVPMVVEGETRWIELSARPRYNGRGRFIGYHGVGSDVTEARRAADRIAHMARHDALTGLPNRLHLLETLGGALDRVRARDQRCAVLLIDLDRFKTVNDSLGHVAGDHLLQQVSTRFDPVISPEMTAGRLGGDEFAIIVPRIADTAMVGRLCVEIIDALKRPFAYQSQHLFVGASIGIAIGPGDGETVQELMRNADLALYRAKAEGGNSVCFYEPGLHARAEERRVVELALRTALEEGEFSLAFQPVVDAASHRVESFEALIRWTNPALGPVPPAEFIPIAEETGLIGRIGEWVLRNACAEAAAWPDGVGVAVNISPIQLQDPGFMLSLISALSHSGLDPHRLELEITETVFLHITPMTQKVLHQIQSLGVRLAIDDFGTGYSSLAYLRDTNFDTIKIDRGFIQAVNRNDSGSGAIIKAVVALAGSLGMMTIAEGVETVEQLDIARDLGCDRIQGYIFSNPLAPADARRLLGDGGQCVAA